MSNQTSHQSNIDKMSVRPRGEASAAQHLLTVNVEDYFQVGVFQKYISPDNWYRFESRLQQNVERVLELLEEHNTKATFFVLGWTAETDPVLVRSIADAGHEIASRGYLHQPLLTLTKEQIRDDLTSSKSLLEDVTGQPVNGFRMSDGWLSRNTLWLLEEVARAGYRYDSSLMPKHRDFAEQPEWRHIQTIPTAAGPVTEIPLTTTDVPGGWLPIAGGNYQRQLPDFLMKRLVDRAVNSRSAPFVMYFQVWELDDEQPKLSVADRITQLRHYRKLGKYQRLLPQYLQRYKFTSIRNHAQREDSPLASLKHCTSPNRERGHHDSLQNFELTARSLTFQAGAGTSRVANVTIPKSADAVAVVESDSADALAGAGSSGTTAVTLVIPCFNEEKSVEYLANTLQSVVARFAGRWSPEIVFVDDCSTDNTYSRLQERFADWSNVRVVQHDTNKGVSAAILTGIREADTDIVASMDCDCSYDPHELVNMLPLLTEDVSMVTASPYHKDGLVRNVPGWRLTLSRGLSALYRLLLRQPLSTWTSCFRIYRRNDILDLPLREDGFLGTAELAAQLILHERHIVEHPATLEVRLFGLSKMKTFRAIVSHLKLLTRMTAARLQTQQTTQQPQETPVPPGTE